MQQYEDKRMSRPMVHGQRILHKLRDVETTLTALARRQPADPGVGELVIEVAMLRTVIERGLEELVP